MSIEVAATSGFCFGVNRAVRLVYSLLEQGEKVCTLGPIIHNPQVVEDLRQRGVLTVDSPEQAPPDSILVIRSHGVPPGVMEEIRAKGLRCADATCPYVSKIQKIAEQAAAKGHTVLIAGDASHPEVQGILGCAGEKAHVFSDEEELTSLMENHPEWKNDGLTVVAQTTFHANLWQKNQKSLKKVYTNAEIFDTICNATALRQAEAEDLACRVDLMVVIGGKQSSNTAKLRDVCGKHTHAILIETAAELPRELILQSAKIGVTAGASTPDGIIKEVLKVMSEIQGQAVENQAADETKAQVSEVTAEVKEEVSLPDDSAQVVSEDQPSAQESAEQAEVAQEEALTQSAEDEAGAQAQESKPEEAPAEEKNFEDMTFEEALEASLKNLTSEQRVTGTVITVGPTEIQVDIGRKHAGFVPVDEYSNAPGAKPEEELKPGDQLELIVMRTNDAEGTVMLSKRRLDAMRGWDKIVAAKDSGEVLEGNIIEVIKGGLLASVYGSRVFIPASHATASRGEPLEDLVGKPARMRIIEINRGRRAVGSIRSVLKEERKKAAEDFWEKVQVGAKFTGKVKSMTTYGAFVDLGGVDGMVHVSELSWQRIKTPSEVVSVGDVIEVYVKDIDPEKKKISLGYKKAEDNPWEVLKRDFAVGDVVPVEIVSLTTYGAFARVIPGIDGLIHVSQIAHERVEKPADVLKVGQTVDVKIIDINFETKRVSLSIKAILPKPEVEAAPEQEPAVVAVSETAEPVAQAEEAPAEPAAEIEEAPAEPTADAEEAPAEPAADVDEIAAPPEDDTKTSQTDGE